MAPEVEPPPDLVDAVVQLSFEVQAVVARAGDEVGLSLTQVRLLGILRDRTPGVVELGRALVLEKSSVSGLIDRAARRDLVERAPDADDGRGVRVALTEHGREVAATLTERVRADVVARLDGLTARERAQLARLADRALTR